MIIETEVLSDYLMCTLISYINNSSNFLHNTTHNHFSFISYLHLNNQEKYWVSNFKIPLLVFLRSPFGFKGEKSPFRPYCQNTVGLSGHVQTTEKDLGEKKKQIM